jgi:methylenetetrahydrofolate reductase (NADPH)
MMEASRLQKVFEAGHFAVTAEIGPPMSADASHVQTAADRLLGIVDAVNITDNQTAIVRMSSLAGACLAQGRGVEAVLQMTCRDRNRIAIQSDLLGAWALGLKNVLCLSGDHQSFGNDRQAKNVYDIDSVQLVRAVADLRDYGTFISGKVSKLPPRFFIGTTANPFAQPQELQPMRLQKKVASGARFVQTQSIYDVESFEDWMEQVRRLGLHEKVFIQAGVMVNKSFRSIEMTGKVPGIRIPEALTERMYRAADQQAEGVAIALEIIERVRRIEGVRGLHIMAVGWESIVPEIIKRAGLLPRPPVE